MCREEVNGWDCQVEMAAQKSYELRTAECCCRHGHPAYAIARNDQQVIDTTTTLCLRRPIRAPTSDFQTQMR